MKKILLAVLSGAVLFSGVFFVLKSKSPEPLPPLPANYSDYLPLLTKTSSSSAVTSAPEFEYGLPSDFVAHMSTFDLSKNPFAAGDRAEILASVDTQYSRCASFDYYQDSLKNQMTLTQQLIVNLKLYFLAQNCGQDYAEYEKNIIRIAANSTNQWVLNVLKADKVEKVAINRKIEVPKNPTKITLGKSKIVVSKQDVVGYQAERVNRDWASYYIFGFPTTKTRDLDKGFHPDYMEGHIVREVLKYSGAQELPLPFIVAKNVSGDQQTYYAPDENGTPRFEVSIDKLHYPTVECTDNTCFSYETHGISSLVPTAIHGKANLVIGCGDYWGKMDAAYYLASKGMNVYFPTDRYVANVLFHDAPGVLIGSAPVKQEGKTAVIGDQPVSIAVAEKIIVQDTSRKVYPTQYYDAAQNYFSSLEKLSGINLDLESVDILGEDQVDQLTSKAESQNAKVIALRVATNREAEQLKEWLRKDPNHRAILFHTVAYPPGQKLFAEFPTQTTFGDTKPVFD